MASFEGLLLRLGRLAYDIPAVAELDLNPVMARLNGTLVVDSRIRTSMDHVTPPLPVGAKKR